MAVVLLGFKFGIYGAVEFNVALRITGASGIACVGARDITKC